MGKDRGENRVAAVQSKSAQSGQTKSKIAAVDGAPEEKGMQVVEDSQSVPLTNDVGLSGDEIDSLGSVLLCILGKVNGIEVTFLIDSGASECFLSTTFVEKNKLKTAKAKEKLRIQLADGTMRVSNFMVEQACVEFEDHTEFLNFSVIPLPKYEAILGKPWLDRWNPVINWKGTAWFGKWGREKLLYRVCKILKAQR